MPRFNVHRHQELLLLLLASYVLCYILPCIANIRSLAFARSHYNRPREHFAERKQVARGLWKESLAILEAPAYANSDTRGYTGADSKVDSKAEAEAEAQDAAEAKIKVHAEADEINNAQAQIETADSGKQHNTEATPTQETRQESMSKRRKQTKNDKSLLGN